MRQFLLAVISLALVSCASTGSTTPPRDLGPYTSDPLQVGTPLEAKLGLAGFATTDRTQETGKEIDLTSAGEGTFVVRSAATQLDYRVRFSYTYDTRLFLFRSVARLKIEARAMLKPFFAFSTEASGTFELRSAIDGFVREVAKLGY